MILERADYDSIRHTLNVELLPDNILSDDIIAEDQNHPYAELQVRRRIPMLSSISASDDISAIRTMLGLTDDQVLELRTVAIYMLCSMLVISITDRVRIAPGEMNEEFAQIDWKEKLDYLEREVDKLVASLSDVTAPVGSYVAPRFIVCKADRRY